MKTCTGVAEGAGTAAEDNVRSAVQHMIVSTADRAIHLHELAYALDCRTAIEELHACYQLVLSSTSCKCALAAHLV
jgi:hypothetical protein